MRRARGSKFAQGSRRRKKGPREAKKIHIKVKRGKPDGVTRSKRRGRKRKRGGRGTGEKGKKDRTREKERRSS